MTGQSGCNEEKASITNRILQILVTLLFLILGFSIFIPIYTDYRDKKQIDTAYGDLSKLRFIVDASIESMENERVTVNMDYWQNWQWSSLFAQIEVINTGNEINLIGVMGNNSSAKLAGVKFIISREKEGKSWFCQIQDPVGKRVILDKWPPRGCSKKWK
jgi:hypothetical protein